jgi:hypothetical protein
MQLREHGHWLLQVCFKGSAVTRTMIVLRRLRRSTPMQLRACATAGFSGAAPSGPRSHLANTDTGCAFASLGSAGSRFAASAKRHAYRQCPLPGRLRTPRTASRARGLRPEKPSADRGAVSATHIRPGIGSRTGLVLVACAAPRSRRVFLARRAPGTHQRCRGCGGGRAMDAT